MAAMVDAASVERWIVFNPRRYSRSPWAFNLPQALLPAYWGVQKRGKLVACGEPLRVTAAAMSANGLLELTSWEGV